MLVRAVRLPLGVTIDLGGIGKGAAADEVSAGLLAAGVPGVTGVLVNLGGDLRARRRAGAARLGGRRRRPAPHRTRRPARTGRGRGRHQHPAAPDLDARGSVAPPPHRSAHRAHLPTAGLASVTVVAGEAWRAEVLAKAAFVAGAGEGAALSKPPGPPACSSPTTATWWSCPGSTGSVRDYPRR